jgi:hypothetical protein
MRMGLLFPLQPVHLMMVSWAEICDVLDKGELSGFKM